MNMNLILKIQKLLMKHKMKTAIVQIHDSIVADVPKNELRTYLKLIKKLLIKRRDII